MSVWITWGSGFVLRNVSEPRIICFTIYGCSCFLYLMPFRYGASKKRFFWIIGKSRWKCRLAGCFVLYRPKNRAGQTGEKGADKAIYRTAYRTGSAYFELFSDGWVKMSYFPFIAQNLPAKKWKPAPHRHTHRYTHHRIPNVNIRYLFTFQKFPFLFAPLNASSLPRPSRSLACPLRPFRPSSPAPSSGKNNKSE